MLSSAAHLCKILMHASIGTQYLCVL